MFVKLLEIYKTEIFTRKLYTFKKYFQDRFVNS